MKDKPKANKSTFDSKTEIPFDPFMPPFKTGEFIEEINGTHNLVFNMYQVCQRHVILATKEFEK